MARYIGYADARPNFHRLQELPERLREHAERVKQRAEAEFEKLRQLDMEGRQADGIPELEARLEESEAAMEGAQEALSALAGRNQEALAELETFAQGTDPDYRKAVELLRSDLEAAPLQVLRGEALATPSPEDDVIVARLRDLNRERGRLQQLVHVINRYESAVDERADLKEMIQAESDDELIAMAHINTNKNIKCSKNYICNAIKQKYRQ